MKRLLPALVLLLAACAQSQGATQGPRGPGSAIIPTSTGVIIRLEGEAATATTIIDADPMTLWHALPETFEALGIPAGVLDESTMTYGNRRFTRANIGDRRTETFVRCAGTSSGPSAASGYRVRLDISSRVDGQADGRSLLVTAVSGSATTVEGTSTAAIRCVSDGQLEALIASIAERLATTP